MGQRAPETPTLEYLQEKYPLDPEAADAVSMNRAENSLRLDPDEPGLLAVLGPCPLTDNELIFRSENRRYARFSGPRRGLTIVTRKCPWKPRSNPDDEHGMETMGPKGAETAYRIISHEANHKVPIAMELAQDYHPARYGPMLSLGWFGSRNIENADFMETVAEEIPDLPLLIKNGMDGSIDQALDLVDRLQGKRGPAGAPVRLLFRGGENLSTRDTWEQGYLAAMERTDNKLVLDMAHGTLRAHDPKGKFERPLEAAILAIDHVLDLSDRGYIPLGVMSEASAAPQTIDPHVPVNIALAAVNRIYRSRMMALAA